jgi:nitroreductase
MNYEDFMEIVRGRRSIRSYKSDPVPEEVINRIIEAAKWAPTGNNTQPLEIVVVKKKSLIKKIEDITGEFTEPKFTQHFGAPVMLVVLGDPRFCEAFPKGFVREEIFHSSLSAAIEHMLLASTVVGMGGSVWKTVSPSSAVKIKDLLGIPQFYILKVLIPLGYPKKEVEAPPKRDIVTHEDHYSMDKLKSEKQVTETIRRYSAVKELNKFRAL